MFCPSAVPCIFGAMKKLLLLILLSYSQTTFSQASYIKKVDSIVKAIEHIDIYYTAGSCEDYNDDSLQGFISIVYKYSDKNGKDLVLVDELNNTSKDSSSVFYYFKNRKLVMVDARVLVGKELYIQKIYYKNDKVIYSSPLPKTKFDPLIFIKRKQQYLRVKSKALNPNYII